MTRTETKTKTGIDLRLGSARTQAYGHRSTDCRCGQQLDLCARAHCPRCGRSITR